MIKSALFLAIWGATTFSVVIAAGALFGARSAAAQPETGTVRWAPQQASGAVCTRQNSRPSWLTAAQFNEVVEDTTQRWSELGAAIRLDYRGDCSTLELQDLDTVLSEISWDVATFMDRPGVDSVALLEITRSSESNGSHIGAASVVLRPWTIDSSARPAANIEALRGLVGHELGHLLGLTHSGTELDLMYNGPVTARVPSVADAQALGAIYGP